MQSVASLNHPVTMEYQERRGALNETVGRVLNRLFGCWQHELSRPFSNNGRTYRICVKCGMSRDFDPGSWKTHGNYQMTGPNVIYSKLGALRPAANARVIHANSVANHNSRMQTAKISADREPTRYTPPTPTNPPQRVSSLGSINQGPLDPNHNAGIAA